MELVYFINLMNAYVKFTFLIFSSIDIYEKFVEAIMVSNQRLHWDLLFVENVDINSSADKLASLKHLTIPGKKTFPKNIWIPRE